MSRGELHAFADSNFFTWSFWEKPLQGVVQWVLIGVITYLLFKAPKQVKNFAAKDAATRWRVLFWTTFIPNDGLYFYSTWRNGYLTSHAPYPGIRISSFILLGCLLSARTYSVFRIYQLPPLEGARFHRWFLRYLVVYQAILFWFALYLVVQPGRR